MSQLVIPDSAGVIAELGAFGLVCWLVLHTFKHTIPRLAGDYKTSLEGVMQEHRTAVMAMSEAHASVLAQERQHHLEQVESLRNDQREDRREFLEKIEALRREIAALSLMVAQMQPNRVKKEGSRGQ